MENNKILLVDDDPFILQSIGPALVKKGYEVATAESGQEALDALDKSPFDLVLTDLIMEDIDGFQVLKEAREREEETMVIILTGYNEVQLAIDCLRLGANDYVLKPCKLEELLFRLKSCFEKLEDKRKIKQTEVELEESQKRLNEAQQLTHVGHWIWNLETQTLTWSDEIYRIFGVSPDKFEPSTELFEESIHPEDLKDFLSKREKMLEEKKSTIIEHRIIRPDGDIRFVEERVNLELDEHKDVICILGTVQDTTERKQAEDQIKASLEEKGILLKEVHHRIRNNMSTIKGLLKLQSRTLVNNPDAVNALKEAENRVQSMLVLYDKLFLTSDYANVSTKKYFETLIDDVIQNFALKEMVRVAYDIEDAILDVKKVFNLGIIVNELITNSMKHAFIGKESGKIYASLSIDQGNAVFTIQNDGTELPESVSFENLSGGFGFKLISMLVNQLDGSIQIERSKGTKFTIKFNIET